MRSWSESGARNGFGEDSIGFSSLQGKKEVKVCHFKPDETENVTLEGMEEEILPLFPDIRARRLGLQFNYRDSFAGTIVLEKNGDVQLCKYLLALLA